MLHVVGSACQSLELPSLLVLERGEEAREEASAPGALAIPAEFAWCGFTPEEWRGLCEAPRRAFLFVAAASGGEVPAGARVAYQEALEDAQGSRSPLVGRLCAAALRQGEAPRVRPLADMSELSALYERVAGRLGLGEAERFKWCLMDVGRRAAEACSGLKGAFGLLGRRERWALAALASSLRLPDARG